MKPRGLTEDELRLIRRESARLADADRAYELAQQTGSGLQEVRELRDRIYEVFDATLDRIWRSRYGL